MFEMHDSVNPKPPPTHLVDVLVNVRTDIEPLCDWLLGSRQGTTHKVCQWLVAAGGGGDKGHREECLRRMLHYTRAPYVFLADDDDYLPPFYIEHLCLEMQRGHTNRIGYIPEKAYLLDEGAWGVSRKRKTLFQTFTMYRRGFLESVLAGHIQLDKASPPPPQYHSGLIIMRGVAEGKSITERKNRYSEDHWPHRDRSYLQLQKWLRHDPEALDQYGTYCSSRGLS